MRPDFGPSTMDTFFGKFQIARAIIRTPKLLEHTEYRSFKILLNWKRRRRYIIPPQKTRPYQSWSHQRIAIKVEVPIVSNPGQIKVQTNCNLCKRLSGFRDRGGVLVGILGGSFLGGFFLGGFFWAGLRREPLVVQRFLIQLAFLSVTVFVLIAQEHWMMNVCLDKV